VWGTQNVNGNGSAQLFFTDSITGWAQTSSSTISHTINGGGPIMSENGPSVLLPSEFLLFQNYPNPFNNSTCIDLQLKQTGNVRVKIFDIKGTEIAVIVNAKLQSGYYEYNFYADNLSSGIYFYRMEVYNNKWSLLFGETKRMILMK
jgi:hypothetical protein